MNFFATKIVLTLSSLGLVSSVFAEGSSFKAQARLFAGITATDPTQLNALMSGEGLETFENVTQFGVEITYPLARFLDVGLRYTRRRVLAFEAGSSSATANFASLSQDAALALVRIPVIRSKFLKLDAFAGAGGTNTIFTINSAGQSGTLTRKFAADTFATPCYSYGASAGVGFKSFFLYVEGGMEMNKVTKLSRTGTVGSSVSNIDLSGQYVLVGLLFDGVTAKQK